MYVGLDTNNIKTPSSGIFLSTHSKQHHHVPDKFRFIKKETISYKSYIVPYIIESYR